MISCVFLTIKRRSCSELTNVFEINCDSKKHAHGQIIHFFPKFEGSISHALLKLDLLNIGLLWQLGLERLKSFLFTLSNWLGVRISILISFGNLSESLDMSLVLLHEVVMHVS
jgi:hypothetical protein